MNWFLIIILVIAVAFFVWQTALFIRDIVKKVKAKKTKKLVDNPSANTEDGKEK